MTKLNETQSGGKQFSINIFSQKCTYHRILMKGIFCKGCARILRVTWSDVFKNSEGNRINVSYYCFDSRSRSCKFLMSVFVILRWLPAWEQGELLSLTTVWIIDAEVGKTCRSQSLYRIDYIISTDFQYLWLLDLWFEHILPIYYHCDVKSVCVMWKRLGIAWFFKLLICLGQ